MTDGLPPLPPDLDDHDPDFFTPEEWEALAKYQDSQAWVCDQMAADPSGGDHDWAGFAEDARMKARAYRGYSAQAEQRQTDHENEKGTP